ncbi:hypothetical protein AWM75_00810 [Aerococcus urinaehominis]|uniref:Uncharacterized protein n=1 Tax=Aerococcus urinaehominis TaxID=128944 RepID=A0A0X8FJY1_9LACT|nr:hypothetical protein [Aerococcus urinaehominis]AMB98622.1 hypothetical protein AWM75_00810 [Aerococcus urinaehominis]SDL95638.1 hypothetical protein SAMN04487985_10321 [Aerococcus urinaehominis]
MLLDALPTDHHFIDLATGRLPLNKEIMQQLLVGIVSDQTILRSQCIDRKFFTSQSYFEYYCGFLNQLATLAGKYGLTSMNQDKLNFIGMNIHNYCFTKIEIRDLFADVNPTFMEDLKEVIAQINVDFIKDLEALLTEYMNRTQIPLANQAEALEYLLFLTLANWPNIAYELGKSREHVRVLVYTGNHGLDIKVRAALYNNVQGFVDIEVIDHTLDWTKSDQLPHDIFILSEQLPFVTGKPCYIFTAFNDLDMMRWVYQQAENLIQTKVK